MAENTKLGSFLLIAAVCVGMFLVLFIGIPALTNAQTHPSQAPATPVPTIPVPEPTESVAPATPEATTSVPPSPTETIKSPAVVTSIPAPSETTSPPLTKTTTHSVTQATAAPTPIPAAAPAADDPILGNWAGSKTMTIVIISVDGSGTATFHDDFSGSASGEFHGAGRDGAFGADFVWENLGDGRYLGKYGDKSLEFMLSGDVLTMTVNPKKLGVMDSEIVNMDIPFEMYRI